MTPTDAELQLATALDRCRGVLSANIVDVENMPTECVADLLTIARWLVANAVDLAMGDEHARARLAAAISPAFPAKGEQ